MPIMIIISRWILEYFSAKQILETLALILSININKHENLCWMNLTLIVKYIQVIYIPAIKENIDAYPNYI